MSFGDYTNDQTEKLIQENAHLRARVERLEGALRDVYAHMPKRAVKMRGVVRAALADADREGA